MQGMKQMLDVNDSVEGLGGSGGEFAIDFSAWQAAICLWGHVFEESLSGCYLHLIETTNQPE